MPSMSAISTAAISTAAISTAAISALPEELEAFLPEELEAFLPEELEAFLPEELEAFFSNAARVSTLATSTLIIPEKKENSGVLIKSHSAAWLELVNLLTKNWSSVMQLSPFKWEEFVAGAFEKTGNYDEVILTPHSGDRGRDVICKKSGIGSIKIIGSVKRYAPSHMVTHDDVRALIGVMTLEQDVSKAILTTTSDFQPQVMQSEQFKPFMPTRLELINGTEMRAWLRQLTQN